MKKTTIVVLVSLMFSLIFTNARAYEIFDPDEWNAVEAISLIDDLSVNVGAAILMEKDTGTIIYRHNEHERLAPASVTKVMTMLLITEAIEEGRISLNEQVTASTYASQMGGSQIYLKEGEQMTVADLLKSIAVASANDASVALAEHLSGSEAAFVSLMNSRANELGMNDTLFANCTGLPAESEHLTCAYDIAIMSRELIRHDLIKEFTTIWMDSVRNGEFGLSNTNKLVRYYNGATGLKTGFTNEAKFCLSATAERDGVEYIAVILCADSSDIRFESAKVLLNHAFSTYTLLDACPDEVLKAIPVTMGTVSHLQPVLAQNEKLLVEKTKSSSLVKTVDIISNLEAPVTAGQELGLLTISDASGNKLKTVSIIADDDVPRLNWGQVFVKYLRLLFVGDL